MGELCRFFNVAESHPNEICSFGSGGGGAGLTFIYSTLYTWIERAPLSHAEGKMRIVLIRAGFPLFCVDQIQDCFKTFYRLEIMPFPHYILQHVGRYLLV